MSLDGSGENLRFICAKLWSMLEKHMALALVPQASRHHPGEHRAICVYGDSADWWVARSQLGSAYAYLSKSCGAICLFYILVEMSDLLWRRTSRGGRAHEDGWKVTLGTTQPAVLCPRSVPGRGSVGKPHRIGSQALEPICPSESLQAFGVDGSRAQLLGHLFCLFVFLTLFF